jgi:hypothetical protein
MIRSVLLAVASTILIATAPGTFAATEKIDITGYWVVTERGREVTMPNGGKVMPGGEAHAAIVYASTGDVASEWCALTGFQDPAGNPSIQVGHCGVFYDNGDVVWLSVMTDGPDDAGDWTILGGTGKYRGATGGGSCKLASRRSDGSSWTTTCTGEITTR